MRVRPVLLAAQPALRPRGVPAGPVSQVVAGRGFYAYEDGRVVRVRGATEEVLDAGPGIEPGSLAIAGRRLYWTRDGLPLSSALR